VLCFAKRNHIRMACYLQRNIGTALRRTRIAGRNKQRAKKRALRQLPRKRMFPPARPDQ
jgi:hypothetical protein